MHEAWVQGLQSVNDAISQDQMSAAELQKIAFEAGQKTATYYAYRQRCLGSALYEEFLAEKKWKVQISNETTFCARNHADQPITEQKYSTKTVFGLSEKRQKAQEEHQREERREGREVKACIEIGHRIA